MIKKTVGDIEYLQFELFAEEPGLVHAILLRGGRGSLSEKGWGCPERPSEVSALFNLEHCLTVYQVHGKEVHLIDSIKEPPPGDGMMTSIAKVGLMMRHADCQVAIFYDPIQRVLANVHAGWRGNVQNIYAETVAKMQAVYGSAPRDLLVGISPSLGPDRSEFIHYKEELPEKFWPFQIRPTYFDLWAIAKAQLEETGVLPHHIQIASQCTFEGKEEFYSYRRDRVKGRNNATVAALV